MHVDERGVVAELALKPNASIAPHTNPSLAYFLVIEGGGFVRVGDEQARVAAGEAVVWPPNVVHSAWTELTPMRAIIVEFATRPAEPLELDSGVADTAAAAIPRDDGQLLTLALRHLRETTNFSLDEILQRWESAYIAAAQQVTHGNVSQAAKLLGINRTTLYNRMDVLARSLGDGTEAGN